MKVNDSDRERTIAELARLLPVPAARDFSAGRQQTLKEHLMSELRPADGPGRSRGRRPRPGRGTLVAGGMAGLVTVAAAAALVVSAVIGPVPHSPGAHRPAPATAAQLLDKVASAAARQPGLAVRANQYEYIKSEIAGGVSSAAPGPAVPFRPPARLPKPHERQIWLSARGACYPGLLEEPAEDFRDMVLTNQDQHGRCTLKPGLNNPTYAWLQSLPADPNALLSMLRADTSRYGKEQDGEMFTTIGDLLNESIVPPKISAALYRTAAMIPGASVDPGAVDAIGRPGVAVAFTTIGSASRQEWIFARNTLQWIGERDVLISNGKVIYATAVVNRAVVDRPGEVPAGG